MNFVQKTVNPLTIKLLASAQDKPNIGGDMISTLIVFAAGIYVGIFLISLMMMAKGTTSEAIKSGEIKGPGSPRVTSTTSTRAY